MHRVEVGIEYASMFGKWTISSSIFLNPEQTIELNTNFNDLGTTAILKVMALSLNFNKLFSHCLAVK